MQSKHGLDDTLIVSKNSDFLIELTIKKWGAVECHFDYMKLVRIDWKVMSGA